MPPGNEQTAILTEEQRALERWSSGDTSGYATRCADDVTYLDDIGAQHRVDGLAALHRYLASLTGKIPQHRYEIVDPKVQLYGDIGILTMGYQPIAPDGQPLTRWKATSVYRRSSDGWRIVHAHWSMVKA